jgi:tRNA(His) 5'-end guanylyltransferase
MAHHIADICGRKKGDKYMNKNDDLGNRMKGYENISRFYLTKKTPVIIRIDGKAFHSFTRGFKRPFDDILIKSMQETAKYLCANIMGCKLAYTQSDEISLLLVDYERNESQPWFKNNLQKMCSVSASMATMAFNRFFANKVNAYLNDYYDSMEIDNEGKRYCEVVQKAINKGAMFDARAFILPKEEVCNYFIWREQDATRNSIQMVAQSLFSHNELQNKNCNELQELMFQEKGVNWNDFATVYKRGSCIVKETYSTKDLNNYSGKISEVTRSRWIVDKEIPIFTQDRDYIDKYVFVKEN